MSKTLEELAKNIDFRMLAGQKRTLATLQEKESLSQREKDDIEGILNLIDSLQDNIVENEILTEQEVFPYLNTEA